MKGILSLRRLSTQSPQTFQSLGVPEFWCTRLAAMGVYTPTHTQASSLPHLYANASLILRAETGSGKTLAYLLPLLELLRLRIEAHDPATQLLPVGLIVAPSVELVSQVCSVARGLYPEHANMVHLCHGERGATRRQNAGLLVATPHAVSEAINPVHLTALRTVVLDEADALLSGAFAAPIRSGLLVQMKQLMPENRPAHVFCAATMPDKGKDSAFTFLTKYYPDALTVTTQGSHRALPQVYQCFLQVDAGLPLSPGERQVLERQVQAAEALGREEGLLLTPPPTPLGEGEEGQAEAVVVTGEEGGTEDGHLTSTPLPPSSPTKGRVDTIARAIASRKGEDEHLALQVEEAAHAKKLWVLTQAAVFDSLLLPARVLGLLEEGQGYQLSESGREVVQALTPGQPTNPLLAPPTNTLTLEGFREGPAPSVKRARAAKLSSSRATRAFIGVEDCSGLPRGFGRRDEGEEGGREGGKKEGKGLITPYHPPLDKTPPALTRDLAALVPPTLLFVNSASQAATLTKWLNERCGGHFGVAELSASLPVETRGRRLDEFASGSIRALVCTNVAARGLDLRNVAHVIQAQFATDTVAYLHRCGRTGRAGARGMVTSLVTRAGMPLAQAIVEGEEGGETLEGAMSSKKSFAKARKRVALVETALKMAEGQQQQQQQQGTA